jgi:hypothetical protein
LDVGGFFTLALLTAGFLVTADFFGFVFDFVAVAGAGAEVGFCAASAVAFFALSSCAFVGFLAAPAPLTAGGFFTPALLAAGFLVTAGFLVVADFFGFDFVAVAVAGAGAGVGFCAGSAAAATCLAADRVTRPAGSTVGFGAMVGKRVGREGRRIRVWCFRILSLELRSEEIGATVIWVRRSLFDLETDFFWNKEQVFRKQKFRAEFFLFVGFFIYLGPECMIFDRQWLAMDRSSTYMASSKSILSKTGRFGGWSALCNLTGFTGPTDHDDEIPSARPDIPCHQFAPSRVNPRRPAYYHLIT